LDLNNFQTSLELNQLPVPLIELVILILYLGSVTFILGIIYQIYVLKKNKKSISEYVLILMITRIFSIISAFFVWGYIPFFNDTIFIFFLPATISELIWSPIILKLFNNNL